MLYLADYVAPPLREQFAQAGVSYADATGWVRVVAGSAMLLITAQGAAKAPKADRPSTTIGRLDGRAAGRIMRALMETDPPLGVRELGARVGVSAGTVSKTLPTLMAHDAVQRDGRGRIDGIDRRQVLARWTADYQVLRSNGTPTWHVAPRGAAGAVEALDKTTGVAVTGAWAGRDWPPMAWRRYSRPPSWSFMPTIRRPWPTP
jgi:hypothetical protein